MVVSLDFCVILEKCVWVLIYVYMDFFIHNTPIPERLRLI